MTGGRGGVPASPGRCLRCRRPVPLCYCGRLVPVATATRVVFLQHPRERRVAIGTAHMAHLGLANSELHLGVSFAGNARVAALAGAPRAAVLFPGPGAHDPAALPGGPPRTLVVVDGTWSQARKVLARNPGLAALPRIGFDPGRPSRYRVRREPAPHCLSTIEAVVEALTRLEGDGPRFASLLAAFEQMVATQLDCAAERGRPYARTRHRRRGRGRAEPLLAADDRLVCVVGEANTHPASAPVPGPDELVHLVALRPATGERFAAVIAPRRALGPSTARHVELPATRLVAGETSGAALARWQAFVHPDDVLCTWGTHTVRLLCAEGDPPRPRLDLRAIAVRRLGRSPGGMEPAAARLGGRVPAAWTDGRAGRRVVALAAVLDALRPGASAAQAAGGS